MKSSSPINPLLNKVLRGQLTAINQYFLHARMCGHFGLEGLNEKEYHYSIQAMKQADQLVERILFLEGLPNLQDLGKLYIGEDAPEMLANDLRLSNEMLSDLRQAIATCELEQDYISRQLLENILKATEEQVDWLESQQWLLQNTGAQNYLQSMMHDD
ncbi:bacterioferritin [Thiolinea disciformis]|uniref:bacterioferritin n=1 Tax=Thiolinea disciformis TaxID=125614 RepID=UPI00036BECB0|nr:bacterioferritin [Thiolinea disciformis]